MSRRLGPVPSTPYSHLLSDTSYGNSRVRVSQPHRINLERPATGSHKATLSCETCGAPVDLTLLSIGSTKAWRLGWAVGGALALALTALGVLGIVDSGPDGSGFLPSTAAFVLGILVSVYTLLHWWHEDGVRGPGLPWRAGRHFVRHFWAGPR
ncbi:hypothetical protein [Kitasatospora sp. NPDC085879]|uniref:hypothetical protein n=1 Tax=Kitasatospora sp. NPDC085879 TaxID=3154769 RepID=UPI000BC4BE69|nr:hypothetical protein [Streptomyces sp. TLI_235]PBC69800.1 hypothetical protein BX265_7153 [Streptomyces sp. TLI_235]